MQTRHDPLPCGVRHWEILTDQSIRSEASAARCVLQSERRYWETFGNMTWNLLPTFQPGSAGSAATKTPFSIG